MDMKRKIFGAFSLVELLITLTAIAIIAMVFTPVISKKLSSEKQTAGSSQNLSEHCEEISVDCMLCDLNLKKCITCPNSIKSYPCADKTATDKDGNSIDCNTKGCYMIPFECKCRLCPQGCESCSWTKSGINCNCAENSHWDENEKKCVCDDGANQKSDGSCVVCKENSAWSEHDDKCVCNEGYGLDDNGDCAIIDNFDIVKIGDKYWTTRNAGDANGPKIPEGVTKCAVNATCEGDRNSKICFQGDTANPGDNVDSEYSGQGRTVCTYNAAKAICEDAGMRLPTTAEFAALAQNNAFSKNNLHFCNHNSSTKSSVNSNCIPRNGGCVITGGNGTVWCDSYALATSNSQYEYKLENNSFSQRASVNNASVRCVAENIKVNFNCPEGCSSCNRQGTCYSCNAGYNLENGVCTNKTTIGDTVWMTINAGDPGGPSIPNNVTKCNVGSTCSGGTTPTCWQGVTSDEYNTDDSGYSGRSRTVCNWYAANLICSHNGMSIPSRDQINALRGGKTSTANIIEAAYKINHCYMGSSASIRTAKCNGRRACKGAAEGEMCFPNSFWGPEVDANNAYVPYLSDGNTLYTHDSISKTYAFSVRCVKNAGG